MIIKLVKEHSAKIHTSLSTILKIIIIFSILYSTYYHLWHIMFANTFLLILLFIPNILKKSYEVCIPREFEYLLFIFIIITFFLGELKGIIIALFFGLTLGFVGFTIMLILFSNSKFKTNYFLTILFAFSFSVMLGTSAELLKYYIKIFLDYESLNSDHPFTMMNLSMVSIGSLLSSIIGFLYMKGYRIDPLKQIVKKFKSKNPNFFKEKAETIDQLKDLISKGESEKLEFKSTLRINLHTKAPDKNIENSVLKTITAFINSEGGILIIGIDNNKKIIGIEEDKFESIDRYNIHFNNIFKERIGKEFIPYIHSKDIVFNEKTIFIIECSKSKRPVFLKVDGIEHFYVRAGAQTTEIAGSRMIEYIKNNFS